MTFEQWWDSAAKTPAPDTYKNWEESCRLAFVAGQAAQPAQPSQARELTVLLAKIDAKAGSGFIPWEIEDAYAAYVAAINAKGPTA